MLNELLVPRRQISFTHVENGRFIPLTDKVPDVLKQPMVRSDISPEPKIISGFFGSPEQQLSPRKLLGRLGKGSIKGYESGYRSGLLKVDDQLYKLKGCRPEGGSHGKQPNGSQTLSIAQAEADVVLKTREVFLGEGFEYPLEPIGFWVYNHILFNGEPNAATIYRAKGDTRLDELLWWLERAPLRYMPIEEIEHIDDVLKRSGQIVGKALRIFHQRGSCWDTPNATAFNTHLGNLVVFPDSRGSAGFGIIDFDNSFNYQSEGNPEDDIVLTETVEAAQEREVSRLTDSVSELLVASAAKQTYPDRHEFFRMLEQLVGRTFFPFLTVEDRNEIVYSISAYLSTGQELQRKHLMTGFENGYLEVNLTEVSWNELTEIVRSVPRARREFSRAIRTAMEGEDIIDQVIEVARRLSQESWFMERLRIARKENPQIIINKPYLHFLEEDLVKKNDYAD